MMFETKRALRKRITDLENANRSLRAELRTARMVSDTDDARAENDALSERLFEMQTTVEVQAEALAQKDTELAEFLNEMREAMGGGGDRGATLLRIRQLREAADSFQLVRDVLAGKFDPDATLLRRLACALGSGSFELDSVLDRANTLAQAHVKNAELFRALQVANQRVAELEDDALDL